MSALEELYYGELDPCERYIKKGSEYYRMTEDILRLEDELFKSVNQEERKLYEEIIDRRNKQEGIIEKEYFIYGFRIGARIMLEILTEPETQFE